MNQHVSTLIQGQFAKDKARNLLLELLSYKISYHQRQKISDEERLGGDHHHSEKRMRELDREKENLIRWIDSLPGTESLEVFCQIEIRAISHRSSLIQENTNGI